MAISPPPRRRLPLNALRATEAAARLGGFAAAGAELGLSPASVAAHVKTLEAELSAPIFRRSARGVTLTEIGARCLPTLAEAFDALARAEQVLRAEATPRRLVIAALPAIAQLWLQPRLPELAEAIPDLHISITALEAPPATKRHGFDVTLFYAPGPQDWLVPIQAPGAQGGLRLSDATWARDWQIWRAGAGPDADLPATGPVHSLYALAVEDAVQGRASQWGGWRWWVG